MRPLAIHQITAMEASPPDLLTIAGQTGCQHACVFVHLPSPNVPFPAVTRAMIPEMQARMASTGATVSNIEYFPLTEDVDLDAFLYALDIGAELGAHRLVTHIHDHDDNRAADNLARLSALAAERNLAVGLEFMGLTPACASIARAVRFIDLAGKPANAGIAIDCLHLVRTGGTPADVAALAADYFSYAQLCDGPDLSVQDDYLPEAMNRMVPGEGVFPIAAILDALPGATAVDVEVPSTTGQQQGISALDRARRAVEAGRRLLDAARPSR
ncbi:TIM barrel protein [Emcibacter sp. SYSU 3D8]|uniref:sugar phosphate isomerase/epimerase family protein n=1 Tax=Emcibacter sp. SYSU 3D8 TaxID=3133969 RepID=UPI0031FE7418